MTSKTSHRLLLLRLSVHTSVAGWGEVDDSENLSFDIAEI